MDPVATVNVVAISQHLDDCQKSFKKLIDSIIVSATTDQPRAAALIINSGGSSVWVRGPRSDPTYWTSQDVYTDTFSKIISAWTASLVFEALKLFLHMDMGFISGPAAQVLNSYNSHYYLSWDDGRINMPETSYVCMRSFRIDDSQANER